MSDVAEIGGVSIRFTLTLENGTSPLRSVHGARFHYTPGAEQIMPVLEEALQGTERGEKRTFVFSPSHDPNLQLDVTRLARILGHPGETLVLQVEVL